MTAGSDVAPSAGPQPTGHQAEGVPWWRAGTVYQVYPRSFADGDGDGVGDLRGLIDRVDHLEYLGVDAVWLSPIFCSPHRDNGYDISDYQAVDPTFGTLDDVDELISELHARGIRLVMDLVVNHTSSEHPWFVESAASLDSPKRDWYIWRPPRPGVPAGSAGAEPTNWESYFSEPAWQLDERTGEYYLHLFAVEQPDLNWDCAEVRDAVYAMMNWWLDRGVDGFRMDVINLISKRHPFTDGPVPPGSRLGDGSAHYISGPRLHEYLQEMHRRVFAGRSAQLIRVGETPGVTIEQARELSDPDRHELDMVFQFEHVDLDRNPHDWKDPVPLRTRDVTQSLVRWQLGLADVGWNSLYWGNHDQPRVVSRFGDDSQTHWAASAKTLATVLYLLRGTAFVYQGDEIGMLNPPLGGREDLADISSVNYHDAKVAEGVPAGEVMERLRRTARDNGRTPMQWDSGRHAGFTTGTPWYPVHPVVDTANVAAQRGVQDSVLEHYRAVIALRRRLRALVEGSFLGRVVDHDQLLSYERMAGDHRIRVVANLSSRPAVGEVVSAEIRRPSWAGPTPSLDTHPHHPLHGTLGGWRSLVWTSTS